MSVVRVNKNIILIGTAHVSDESVKEVKDIISREKPDYIGVELDRKRFESLQNKTDWKKIPITSLIRSDKLYVTLANFLMAAFQKMIGQRVGSKPGEEMKAAIEAARETGAKLVFLDNDVSITLKRVLSSMSFREKIRILKELIFPPDTDELDMGLEELLDNYNDKKLIDNLIEELKTTAPGVHRVLLLERNAIMAKNILALPRDSKIVAVVGAAHVDGIKYYLENPDKIPEIKAIKTGFTAKFLFWAVPSIFLILFFIALLKGISIKEEAVTWILLNGSLSALATLFVKGSLPAVVVAFIAAPITSLSPFLAAGWFAGITEAWYRRVTFEDLEQASKLDDISALWNNRAFRVLVVTAAANIGSSIGTFISIPAVLSPLVSKLRHIFV